MKQGMYQRVGALVLKAHWEPSRSREKAAERFARKRAVAPLEEGFKLQRTIERTSSGAQEGVGWSEAV